MRTWKLKILHFLVKWRDGFKCRDCGNEFPPYLVVHAVNWNVSDTRMRNLVTLCNACHKFRHDNHIYTNYGRKRLGVV